MKLPVDVYEALTEIKAILDGHFVLNSGKHSDAYVNKDTVYTRPGHFSFLCNLIAFEFRNDEKIEVVAGPTIGAVSIAQEVAKHLSLLTGRNIRPVYVDEANGERVVKRGFEEVVKGKGVLLTEDILTTAGSAKKTKIAIEEADGNVLAISALVNRNPTDNNAESLGVAKLHALVNRFFKTYEASECPLCKQGVEINIDIGHGAEYVEKHEQPQKQ